MRGGGKQTRLEDGEGLCLRAMEIGIFDENCAYRDAQFY
jgi:hypothetical protein